jgi:hypothetical protein
MHDAPYERRPDSKRDTPCRLPTTPFKRGHIVDMLFQFKNLRYIFEIASSPFTQS